MNRRVETQVARSWFRTLATTGLWYIAIAIIVYLVLQVISALGIGGFKDDFSVDIVPYATYIFMLVVGIIFSLTYQKYYIAMGVTRTQLVQGILLALGGFALVATLVHVGIYLALNYTGALHLELSMLPLQALVDFALFVFYYLLGWLVAWGFMWGRFVTAAPCLIVGIVALNGMNWLVGGSPLFSMARSGIPEGIGLLIAALACVVLIMVIRALVKRQPFKAS